MERQREKVLEPSVPEAHSPFSVEEPDRWLAGPGAGIKIDKLTGSESGRKLDPR